MGLIPRICEVRGTPPPTHLPLTLLYINSGAKDFSQTTAMSKAQKSNLFQNALSASVMTCILTFCQLGNFSCFLSSDDFFSKSTLSKNSFRNTIRVSNSLDPDQARHLVGPDLGPNCLQRLSAVDTSRQRVSCKVLQFNILTSISSSIQSNKLIFFSESNSFLHYHYL